MSLLPSFRTPRFNVSRTLFALVGLGSIGIASPTARANDGSGDIAVGGTVRLLNGHASIRMVSEEVRIKLPEGRVETRFVFKNEGPAVSAVMIFPERGYPKHIDLGQYRKLQHSLHARSTQFGYFRSYVDGCRARVTRLVQHFPGKSDDDGEGYEYWWAKRVHFGRGQTRRVVNYYQGGLGWGGYWPERGFSYLVHTGSSWKGSIGHARIICDIGDIRNSGLHRIGPAGYRREGNKLVWEFRNFRPDEDDDISVCWLPGGFGNVRVNGRPALAEAASGWEPDTWGSFTPRKRGGEVTLALRTAAAWLGASVKPSADGRSIRLTRAGRTVEVRRGSHWLRTPTGRLPMARTARLVNEFGVIPSTVVELRPLVQALGGKSWFNPDGGLEVHLPTREMSARRSP